MLVLIYFFFISNSWASDRDHSYPLGGSGNVIAVESMVNFCMFLPPLVNETIADSEGYPFAESKIAALFAVSHCTQSNPNAPGHRLFYEGSIIGAHFVKTDTTVQVTGRINASAAGLVINDGGSIIKEIL